MYSNMSNFGNYSSYPMSYNPRMSSSSMSQSDSDRLIGGGFFGPFLLGGITGGLLAPAFYPRPYYRPYPGPQPGPYRPYPYYGPYYR